MRPEIIPFWISLLRYQELAAADVVEFQIVADVASVVVPRQGIFLQGVEADQHQIWVPSQPPKNTDILRHTHLAGPFSIYGSLSLLPGCLREAFLTLCPWAGLSQTSLTSVTARICPTVQQALDIFLVFSYLQRWGDGAAVRWLSKKKRPHNVWRCCEKKPQPEYLSQAEANVRTHWNITRSWFGDWGHDQLETRLLEQYNSGGFWNQSQSSQSILHCFPRLLKTACLGKIC